MSQIRSSRRWVRRQTRLTRLTHWLWTVCLFFLLLTGLQIFNAHPVLYIGDQSGFAFDNTVLEIGASDGRGITTILGWQIDTTGVLGFSDGGARAFPAWATIPSHTDLATGRVIHFFFAWILVVALGIWLFGALVSGHLRLDLWMRVADWRHLAQDLRNHARLQFRHGARYGPLQRLSYGMVLFVLFPLIIASGLAMSPGLNAALPWLPDLLGGRQTARTLHFLAALGLCTFFFVHIAMVILAGPVNELRAILTGLYLADAQECSHETD